MHIKSAINPKYVDATNSAIDLVIDVEGIGVIPFTASATDIEEHGRKLHADALAGTFGPISAFVPRVKEPAELEQETSNQAKSNLTKLRADTYPDVLAFLATLPGAPKTIKDAATLAATEKSKVKP